MEMEWKIIPSNGKNGMQNGKFDIIVIYVLYCWLYTHFKAWKEWNLKMENSTQLSKLFKQWNAMECNEIIPWKMESNEIRSMENGKQWKALSI